MPGSEGMKAEDEKAGDRWPFQTMRNSRDKGNGERARRDREGTREEREERERKSEIKVIPSRREERREKEKRSLGGKGGQKNGDGLIRRG